MARQLPGEKIYKRLKAQLGKRYKGQVVAIDPRTGKYLIGRDELTVALLGKKKYPGAHFSVFRIGHPAVHKFRKRS